MIQILFLLLLAGLSFGRVLSPFDTGGGVSGGKAVATPPPIVSPMDTGGGVSGG